MIQLRKRENDVLFSIRDFAYELIRHDKEKRLFGVWCARRVQHLMENQDLINCINAAEAFANGQIPESMMNACFENTAPTAKSCALTDVALSTCLTDADEVPFGVCCDSVLLADDRKAEVEAIDKEFNRLLSCIECSGRIQNKVMKREPL
jgi:hypothetical protein